MIIAYGAGGDYLLSPNGKKQHVARIDEIIHRVKVLIVKPLIIWDVLETPMKLEVIQQEKVCMECMTWLVMCGNG